MKTETHRGYTAKGTQSFRPGAGDLMGWAASAQQVGRLTSALASAAECISALMLELPAERREELRDDVYLNTRIRAVRGAIGWV